MVEKVQPIDLQPQKSRFSKMQKWIGYRGVFFTFISPVRVAAQDLHCFYAALTGLIFVDIIK